MVKLIVANGKVWFATTHELRLQGNGNSSQGLNGKINPCLLNLKHLAYLDLSLNNFARETIPSFIGSFTSLEHLDLSDAGFEGKIPHHIGNLSNLHTLYLESLKLLNVENLEWLSGLSKLEYLNLNGVNLSRATNWAEVITSIPSLLEIHFYDCSLDFLHPPNNVNLTSLTSLDLSENQDYYDYFHHSVVAPVPRWCFQLSNLLFLDLSLNNFAGPIQTISNATKIKNIYFFGASFVNSSIPNWLYFCKDLEYVNLSFTDLHGKISEAIANLTSLQTLYLNGGKLPREITDLCRINSLYLSSNELQGEVRDPFGNMSDCFLGSLEDLELKGNQLSGHLIGQFGEFKILQTLDLSNNSLSGAIPISLGNLSSLEELWLDDNNFTGNLPESLVQLLNLESLHIANNKLEGIVTESHFANLSNLVTFVASGNHLALDVCPNWIPPTQLEKLGLGSWRLGVGSQIPSWLQTRRNITQLDLSNTGISGTIPRWFLDILFLNVSHNNLHGKIALANSSERLEAQYLFLSSNQFSGSLPLIGVRVGNLDLSHNLFSEGISDLLCDTTNEYYELVHLNLEGNRLSGELPDCFWKKWIWLTVLKLGNNTMSGSIPNSIGFLESLES